MIPTTGSVIIDGVRSEDINLNALRANITIIPQDPVRLSPDMADADFLQILLSGSLRFNLVSFASSICHLLTPSRIPLVIMMMRNSMTRSNHPVSAKCGTPRRAR